MSFSRISDGEELELTHERKREINAILKKQSKKLRKAKSNTYFGVNVSVKYLANVTKRRRRKKMDNRSRNAEIFEDTKKHYETDDTLKDIVKKSMSRQRFISEKATISISVQPENGRAQVKVSGKRSLEAAEFYEKQGKKVCVLNFASATNPGGGVAHGASAQEECICRCTTLYPCLNSNEMWQRFYAPHRKAANQLYNNDCIYTPQVCVFKSDTRFPEMLPRNEWWYTDIISCAAPNLREKPSNPMNPYSGNKAVKISNAELEELLTSRIRRIFQLAAANENDVLVLGAFGCGAFRNPPELVARVFRKVMEEYIGCFDTIEYAVYHTERETANYNAFCKAMK